MDDINIRGLWAGVMLIAFSDLKPRPNVLRRKATKNENPFALRAAALDWIHKPQMTISEYCPVAKKVKTTTFKTTDVGGFEWVADVLDLDPETLRQCSLTHTGINRVLQGDIIRG